MILGDGLTATANNWTRFSNIHIYRYRYEGEMNQRTCCRIKKEDITYDVGGVDWNRNKEKMESELVLGLGLDG